MQIHHILNRGVEGKKIFRTTQDHMRFAHNLRDFNNREVTFLSYPKRRRKAEVTPPTEKDKIVDVLCWCEMENHFHVMVKERIDGGSSMYAKKITGGYTMYFNPRHQRQGTLFQSRSKVIPVVEEPHWLHLPFYILANPLSFMQTGWKTRGIKNPQKAVEFLEQYRWSAFPDLLGKNNFPYIINRKLFFELFDLNEKRLKQELLEWISAYDLDDWYKKQWSKKFQ